MVIGVGIEGLLIVRVCRYAACYPRGNVNGAVDKALVDPAVLLAVVSQRTPWRRHLVDSMNPRASCDAVLFSVCVPDEGSQLVQGGGSSSSRKETQT